MVVIVGPSKCDDVLARCMGAELCNIELLEKE